MWGYCNAAQSESKFAFIGYNAPSSIGAFWYVNDIYHMFISLQWKVDNAHVIDVSNAQTVYQYSLSPWSAVCVQAMYVQLITTITL